MRSVCPPVSNEISNLHFYSRAIKKKKKKKLPCYNISCLEEMIPGVRDGFHSFSFLALQDKSSIHILKYP